jgi:hypothetical protein
MAAHKDEQPRAGAPARLHVDRQPDVLDGDGVVRGRRGLLFVTQDVGQVDPDTVQPGKVCRAGVVTSKATTLGLDSLWNGKADCAKQSVAIGRPARTCRNT